MSQTYFPNKNQLKITKKWRERLRVARLVLQKLVEVLSIENIIEKQLEHVQEKKGLLR